MPWLFIALGLVGLTLGAEALVRGSAALARRLGMSPLVIGLTIVAFGTSAPELIVSLQAAFADNGAIAIGNVVGSNIGNIALILGLAALIQPMRIDAKILRIDLPLLLVATGALCACFLDDRIGRLEGALLTLGIVAYIGFTIVGSRRETDSVQAEFEEALPRGPRAFLFDAIWIVVGLGFLVLGARALVDGAVAIAESLGLSQTVIGLTIVAVGTSLPELATSVVAAFRKESDIAVGNVVGSNLFNILGILGPTALLHPIPAGGLTRLDLGALILTSVAILPLMRTGFRLERWEGGLLLATYVGYVTLLLR
ncbi:MAG: calcium/sodium antiporter [Candidatus Eisenbacteria bacterium]